MVFIGLAASCSGEAPKTVKKEFIKEIRMNDENGIKTLKIQTIENGKKTMETYTGEKADAKMKQLEKEAKIKHPADASTTTEKTIVVKEVTETVK